VRAAQAANPTKLANIHKVSVMAEMKSPSALKKSPATLAVLVLFGLAIGGYFSYMKYSATGIEATLEYSSVLRNAMPEETNVVHVFENQAELALLNAGNNEYSVVELQELRRRAAVRGRIFLVPVGTKVLILDRHYWGHDIDQIRILGGPSSGETGYVIANEVRVPFWSDI